MKNTTQLFLAYVNYKTKPQPRISFAEYVETKPDLASLILVSMIAADNGIQPAPRRGRKARAQ